MESAVGGLQPLIPPASLGGKAPADPLASTAREHEPGRTRDMYRVGSPCMYHDLSTCMYCGHSTCIMSYRAHVPSPLKRGGLGGLCAPREAGMVGGLQAPQCLTPYLGDCPKTHWGNLPQGSGEKHNSNRPKPLPHYSKLFYSSNL